jgi:hypothetical protein
VNTIKQREFQFTIFVILTMFSIWYFGSFDESARKATARYNQAIEQNKTVK